MGTQPAQPWGCFRSWGQGREAEWAGQEPKTWGQRVVRQKPYGGKVSGDFHYLPSAGDLQFPAKMPLLGAALELKCYCLEADRAHPQLAGGCWLPRVSQAILECHDPLRHCVTCGENQSCLGALWSSCETLIQAAF